MGHKAAAHETVGDPLGGAEGGGPLVDPHATAEERRYAMWIHLGGLIAAVVAAVTIVGFWAPPLVVLIMWMRRRETSPFIDDHGREAMNFQVSLLLLFLAVIVLAVPTCGIGLVAVPVLYVFGAIGLVLAAVAAGRGEYFRYPATIRLIR
ncbi:MAG TPA: DUF4870 domain-containing protein [Phycisphaerales bacterium]|nr:DUF4870 domain-containing protein [Phycisphaerales bacterium]